MSRVMVLRETGFMRTIEREPFNWKKVTSQGCLVWNAILWERLISFSMSCSFTVSQDSQSNLHIDEIKMLENFDSWTVDHHFNTIQSVLWSIVILKMGLKFKLRPSNFTYNTDQLHTIDTIDIKTIYASARWYKMMMTHTVCPACSFFFFFLQLETIWATNCCICELIKASLSRWTGDRRLKSATWETEGLGKKWALDFTF